MKATLTPKQKERVRYLYFVEKLTQLVIAIRFGVSPNTISKAVRGK